MGAGSSRSERPGEGPEDRTAGRWRAWAIAGVEAGAGLGFLDAGLAMGWHGEWLPSRGDRFVFALSIAGTMALAVGIVATLLAWLVARAASLPTRWRNAVAQGAVIAFGFVAGFGAFSGTAMRHSPARPYAILATVVLCAWLGQVLFVRWQRLVARIETRRGWTAAALLVASASLYVVHAVLYVRLYPVLHALAAAASVIALVTSLALGIREVGVARVGVLATVITVAGVAGATGLMRSQTRRALARERAPVSGYVVRALGRAFRTPSAVAVVHDDRTSRGGSLELRGHDIVLVTVDALRPDRLGIYGGPQGLTPALDALAGESVVVEQAYCTTPHTSYSLASLMTGKFFREVSALGTPSAPHQTIAGLLGDSGYRTAAFYPPAIWQVDGERLGDLHARGFDFTDRFESWDDAATRVAHVREWLDRTPADRRVFVWVHLFEPHEAYELHPGARTSGATGALGRYDSEVAVVDDAIATLRRVFDERGRGDATWIVTADHGEEFGEHGGQFHGTTVYEEQVRVPLLVRAHGLEPRRIMGPASLVDLLPTLAAGVGIDRPARLRGRDLGLELRGGATQAAVYASAGSSRLVAFGTERLVCDVAEGSCALFDLRTDAAERDNRADRDPGRARVLREWMNGWEGSHARFEAERGGEVLPDPVVRLLQGDRTAAIECARALPTISGSALRRTVSGMADAGVRDPSVRDALASVMAGEDAIASREAAVALAMLGDPRGEASARAVLRSGEPRDARRAALGLARLGATDGASVLAAWAVDRNATDAEVDAAIDALEPLRVADAIDTWVNLLGNPRLVVRAARALGAAYDARAIEPLGRMLDATRYPAARSAAVTALRALHDTSLAERLQRVLARMEPDPEMFTLVADAGPLGESIPHVARTPLRAPGVTLRARRETHPLRWIARFVSSERGAARIGTMTLIVPAGGVVARIPNAADGASWRIEWDGSPAEVELLGVPENAP